MDKKNLIILAAVPMTVPVSENETEAQFLERWRKVDALPAEKKEILSSDITIGKIEDVAKRFRLTYGEACDISRLVRSVVFGEINVSQVDSYLKQKIQHIEQADRDNVKNIIVEILSQQPILSMEAMETESRKKVQLSLSEALLKYPKVGEQNITTDQIKLKYFPTLVRPSVKNWITDFHDAMGAGKHSPIDRGNFLFHSENGKKLSSTDRQKLGTILKSLDEQTLLTIDGETQIIVFENVQQENTRVIPDSIRNPEQSRNLDSRFHGNDNIDMKVRDLDETNTERAPRESRADVNLKQDQRLTSFNSHDVFGDLSSVSELEESQSKNFQEKMQGFFANNKNKNVENISVVENKQPAEIQSQQRDASGNLSYAPNFSAKAVGQIANTISSEKAKGGIVKNFFSSAIAPAPIKIDDKKVEDEEKNNFFQIPQSKPPIGSESYHAQSPQNPNKDSIEKNQDIEKVANVNNTQTSLPSGHQPRVDEQLSLRVEAGLSSSEERKIMNESSEDQDRDSMSDELLYKMLQEKKIKQGAADADLSFGSVKFSSPQQLPAEQGSKPAQIQTPQPQRSPFHITPSDYASGKKIETKNETMPKITGNVVDLR